MVKMHGCQESLQELKIKEERPCMGERDDQCLYPFMENGWSWVEKDSLPEPYLPLLLKNMLKKDGEIDLGSQYFLLGIAGDSSDMKTPKEYLGMINEEYFKAKKKRLSRFSEEWGLWSVAMNRTLRKRTEGKKDIETMKFRYVFIYWTLVSELLELNHKYRLLHMRKKKRIVKEVRDIKEIILTGNGLQPLSEEELVNKLIKRNMEK